MGAADRPPVHEPTGPHLRLSGERVIAEARPILAAVDALAEPAPATEEETLRIGILGFEPAESRPKAVHLQARNGTRHR
jgi:hypothetical protein